MKLKLRHLLLLTPLLALPAWPILDPQTPEDMLLTAGLVVVFMSQLWMLSLILLMVADCCDDDEETTTSI